MSNVKHRKQILPEFSPAMLRLFLMGRVELHTSSLSRRNISYSRRVIENRLIRKTGCKPEEVDAAFDGRLKNKTTRAAFWKWLGIDPENYGTRLCPNGRQEVIE